MNAPVVLTVVKAAFAWRITEDTATSRFLAECPALNISLSASSREELFSLIPESLDSLFTSLDKRGDWDGLLEVRIVASASHE